MVLVARLIFIHRGVPSHMDDPFGIAPKHAKYTEESLFSCLVVCRCRWTIPAPVGCADADELEHVAGENLALQPRSRGSALNLPLCWLSARLGHRLDDHLHFCTWHNLLSGNGLALFCGKIVEKLWMECGKNFISFGLTNLAQKPQYVVIFLVDNSSCCGINWSHRLKKGGGTCGQNR